MRVCVLDKKEKCGTKIRTHGNRILITDPHPCLPDATKSKVQKFITRSGRRSVDSSRPVDLSSIRRKQLDRGTRYLSTWFTLLLYLGLLDHFFFFNLMLIPTRRCRPANTVLDGSLK